MAGFQLSINGRFWVSTEEEYVRGPAHTNTVEGFFSLLKRGINGVYHHVGKGHLNRYCDEFSFRYNLRGVSDGERANKLVEGAEGKRLTYKQPAIAGTPATGDVPPNLGN
jgi:hypothetical protein